MCFGEQQTGDKTTTSTANPAVSSAATNNLNFAQGVQSSGFTPFTGQMVAPISGQQQESFGMADAIGASPNLSNAGDMINNYASAPAQSVNANTISSAMDPYMSQYVAQSLAPQLEAQNQQFDTQNRGAAANATMAGAFGNDSQDALYRSNLTNQQDIARTGLIGQAYNNAFNTAIGAGAQDVANNLNAQTTNANLAETALGRQQSGAADLENLTGAQEGVANTINTMGQQQTAQNQAQDNANYQQYQAAQQYPFLSTELMNQTIGAGAQAMPASTDTVTSAPDNSGLGILGAVLPAAIKSAPALMALSDKREKENIQQVGQLRDGTPVKTFNYAKDPKKRQQLGLVAQDVEKRNPAAVREIGGRKHIDVHAALAPSRALEDRSAWRRNGAWT